MPRVPYVPIKIFFLPEASRPAKHFIRFVRRERFQRMHNSRKSLSHARRAERVDVIWHDDPSGQTVFLLIMKQQRILHHRPHLGLSSNNCRGLDRDKLLLDGA